MAAESKGSEESINLQAVIGFGGNVTDGLICHPDGVHVVYPLGSTVVIKNTVENTQAFLQGHTDKVSCVSMSADGKYLASGQVTAMGFQASVIVWDVEAGIRNANTPDSTGEIVYKLMLHKVKVQDVSFSPDGRYLATLGGEDDNNVVVWNLETGKAICGSPAASYAASSVRWFNNRSDMLVTAGQYNLRVWEFDLAGRKLRPTDCHLGQLKRNILSIVLDPSDGVAYCGTKTGDLLEVNVGNGRFVRAGKNRFSLGITAITLVEGRGGNTLIVGTGDGTIASLSTTRLAVTKSAKVMGAITSLSLHADGDVLAGTNQGNTYKVDPTSLEVELRSTAHYGPINDVCFPSGSSDIFVTCSTNDIRVWNARTRLELLRIQVPNLECNCIAVMPNGRSIVSGWDDGKIRAFFPESGKLQYVITDAHAESVTSVSCTHDATRLVSGGKDGRVRVWNVEGRTQNMELSFKEHKGAVNSIYISADDSEAVTASSDGSCIVWNIRRGVRVNAMFASTMFRSIVYHPDESQILTCGSDRKITYWDASDFNAIRILDGSSMEVNALDIEPDGILFVSGGKDKLVKVWHYDEGVVTGTGVGHSGGVLSVKISPDQSKIVSVGSEGAIFVWTMPAAGSADLAADGYVAKAGVKDEVDDEAVGLAALREEKLEEARKAAGEY